MLRRGCSQLFELGFPVGNAGQDRHYENSRLEARFPQSGQGLQSQNGPRSARLERPRQPLPERRDGNVDVQLGARRDFLQNVHVANNLVGFGCNRKAQASRFRERFQNGAGHAELALGGLIGIGRRADGNGLAAMPKLEAG